MYSVIQTSRHPNQGADSDIGQQYGHQTGNITISSLNDQLLDML